MPIRVRSRLLTGSRPVLVAAALLPALALTAACGGDDGKKQPETVKASGAVPVAKLTEALLTSSDVSKVQVLQAGSTTQLLGARQTPDKPACQPIADQWSTQPAHPRQVYAGAMVTDTAAKDANAKTISLTVIASYKKGEAKTVLDELTTALKTCTTYHVTRSGTKTTFLVKTAPVTSTLGDQRVAYTIADASQPTGIVLVTVIRVGDTTAAYETVRADKKVATLRDAIPLKQVQKLRAAADGS
ncbi:MAG: hypothetical protein QOF98_1349 [Streptomyces sp.]|nr:hypothetical protein [Streptomyces sp.]